MAAGKPVAPAHAPVLGSLQSEIGGCNNCPVLTFSVYSTGHVPKTCRRIPPYAWWTSCQSSRRPTRSLGSPLPSFGQYASYAWTGRPFIGVVMCVSRADRVEPTAAPKGVAGPLLGQNVKPPTTTPHATTVSTIQFRMAVSPSIDLLASAS